MKTEYKVCRRCKDLSPPIEQCIETWDYWPLEDLRSALENTTYRLYALLKDEVCAGVLLIFEMPDSVDVMYIYTHPSYRKQGVALQLLEICEAELKKENQAHKIFLEVRKDNYQAIQLYAAFQMKKIGIRKRYYKDGCDALIYVKEF